MDTTCKSFLMLLSNHLQWQYKRSILCWVVIASVVDSKIKIQKNSLMRKQPHLHMIRVNLDNSHDEANNSHHMLHIT